MSCWDDDDSFDENTEPVEISCEIKAETDLAYLVWDGKTEVWLPKSQILSMRPESGSGHVLEIPEWLATEKGLV